MQRPTIGQGAETKRLQNAEPHVEYLYHTSPPKAQGSLQKKEWEC